MGLKKIVGIQKINKKDGSGCAYKVFYTEPYSDYEIKNGDCVGLKTGSEYISMVDCSYLKVGDEVKFYKEEFGSYLLVTEIKVVNPAK